MKSLRREGGLTDWHRMELMLDVSRGHAAHARFVRFRALAASEWPHYSHAVSDEKLPSIQKAFHEQHGKADRFLMSLSGLAEQGGQRMMPN